MYNPSNIRTYVLYVQQTCHMSICVHTCRPSTPIGKIMQFEIDIPATQGFLCSFSCLNMLVHTRVAT